MQTPLTLYSPVAEKGDDVAANGPLPHRVGAPSRVPASVGWRGQGQGVPAIAVAVGVCQATARVWIKRFKVDGLAGLADAGRGGRQPTYTAAEISEVIAASLTDPQALSLPFAAWKLDRLAAYLAEVKDIPIKRSRISEVLRVEGLRWRIQKGWFGERPDPAFAEKGGASSASPWRRPTMRS